MAARGRDSSRSSSASIVASDSIAAVGFLRDGWPRGSPGTIDATPAVALRTDEGTGREEEELLRGEIDGHPRPWSARDSACPRATPTTVTHGNSACESAAALPIGFYPGQYRRATASLTIATGAAAAAVGGAEWSSGCTSGNSQGAKERRRHRLPRRPGIAGRAPPGSDPRRSLPALKPTFPLPGSM